MLVNNNNLVWIDMEMTGLDPEHCVVLEIASIVTDDQLNVLAEGPVIAIHQPDTILDNMDPWCVETHGNSGLTQRCKDSQASVESASDDTIAFLQQYVDAGASPLCGNSIGQDRRFLVKHMPALEAFFHYRNIDVSSVKELVRRWKPELLEQFTKKGAHLALDDIRESIDEMRFYRQHVFSI